MRRFSIFLPRTVDGRLAVHKPRAFLFPVEMVVGIAAEPDPVAAAEIFGPAEIVRFSAVETQQKDVFYPFPVAEAVNIGVLQG